MSQLAITRHDAAQLQQMRGEVLGVYNRVYTTMLDDPFRRPERFWERLEGYASREGFGMVVGRVDRAMVGFALGYRLPAGSRWWEHLRGENAGDEEFTREDGSRTFAFNELMVAPQWRKHGFGRALHDALLADRPEARATLLVRPDNEPARSAYPRWGWWQVGTIQPFPDSPVFDAMLRQPPAGAG
jgi:ribosomal protein S18 acetylase RimI-like enzyme